MAKTTTSKSTGKAEGQAAGKVKPPRRAARRRGLLWRVRRSLRKRMNGAYLGDVLTTLVWVAPLTLLIWGVAEREQASSRTEDVLVSVESADQARTALLEDGRQSVTLELEGPRGGIARVLQQLRSPTAGPLPIPVPTALPLGEHTIEVAPLLDGESLFQEAGVNVISATPPTVQVIVDDRATRELDVRLPRGADATLRAGFDPSTVTVNGPAATVGRDDLVAVAELRDRDRPRAGEERALRSASVRLVDGDGEAVTARGVSLEPATVGGQVRRVPAQERELEIPSMLLRVSKPAAAEARWRVVPAVNTVFNVTVRGPAEVIDRLERGDVRPAAVLEVPGDVAAGLRSQARVTLDLPPGVSVVGEPPTVEYTVEELPE